MTRLLSGIALAAFLAVGFVQAAPAALVPVAENCLAPIKPIPPYGCRDLVPQCFCDERGEHCQVEWICVPN